MTSGCMKRPLTKRGFLLLFGLWAVVLLPQPQLLHADAIRILITVLDARPLTKDQVAARLDNQPVNVLALEQANNAPLVFAVLVDSSRSQRKWEKFERKSSLELFSRLAAPPNVGFLGDFNDGLYLNKKTTSLSAAEAALKAIPGFRGGTALYDSIVAAAKLVNKVAGQAGAQAGTRAVIFVFTDGEDDTSRESLKQAIRQIQTEGVTVFSIGTFPYSPSRRAVNTLRQLSQSTGGDAMGITQDTDVTPGILRALQDQYWITTTLPPNVRHHKLHSLVVTSAKAPVSAPTQILVP